MLKAAGIDAVSLANNHTLDFGYDAMREMLELLDANCIKHAGAGLNHSEAFEPAFSKLEGATIALIAFTDNEPQWEAMTDKEGIVYVPVDVTDDRAQELFTKIGALKKGRSRYRIGALGTELGLRSSKRAHPLCASHDR